MRSIDISDVMDEDEGWVSKKRIAASIRMMVAADGDSSAPLPLIPFDSL